MDEVAGRGESGEELCLPAASDRMCAVRIFDRDGGGCNEGPVVSQDGSQIFIKYVNRNLYDESEKMSNIYNPVRN